MAKRRVLSLIIDLKENAGRQIDRLTRVTFGGLSGAVKAVSKTLIAGGVALVGFTAALAALAKRGSEVLTVQAAFNRAAGDGESALLKLREASKGLISNYDLMVGFNRALTLGAVDSTEAFAELTETAISLGRALGVDAAFALESLSLGIGRQSKLILDNLGLIVSLEKANESYARSVGKTTDQLTDQEKALAFRTATMESARQKIEELGGFEENAGDAAARFAASLKNAKDELAEFLATAPLVADFFNTLAQALDDAAVLATDDTELMEIAFELLGQVAGLAFAQAYLEVLAEMFRLAVPDIVEKGLARLGLVSFPEAIAQGLENIAREGRDNLVEAIELLNILAESRRRGRALEGGGGRGGGGGGGGGGVAGTPGAPDLMGGGFMPGQVRGIGGGMGGFQPIAIDAEVLSTWEKLLGFVRETGDAVRQVTENQESMAEVTGGILLQSINNFGNAFEQAGAAAMDSSRKAGDVFKQAMLGAIGAVARGFGEMYAARAIAAFASGNVASGIGFTSAAAAMFTLSGALGAAGGGASAAASAPGGATEGLGQGEGVIVVQGGLLDMSDDRQAQALARAIKNLTGRRILIQGG